MCTLRTLAKLALLALWIAATSCRNEDSTARPAEDQVANEPRSIDPWRPKAASSTPDAQAEGSFARCVPQTRRLYLPWPGGETRLVLQAWNGDFSHKGEYAIDVAQELGTPVLAADDGIVTQVLDGFADVGGTEDDVYHANYVELDHGDGRFTQYLHLQKNTIRVHEGDRVARGNTLGLTGNSGFSTRPHVHFAVVDVFGKSVPACIEGVTGGVPKRGFETSTNTATASAPTASDIVPSQIPKNTFGDLGVMLLTELPARRWTVGERLSVRARVATPGATVTYSLAPRDSHLRVGLGANVESDPRGHVTLDIVLPTQEGRYELQFAQQGNDVKPRSVPIIVRPRAIGASSPASTSNDLHGPWHDAYPNGGRAEQGSYDHGIPIGRWTGWYENGSRKYEGSYAAGKLDGPWATWYESGVKRSERAYAQGVPTGMWREWASDGSLVFVGEYDLVDGTGTYVEQFESGRARQRGQYRNGAKDGVWTRWHASGVIAETTSYRRGVKDGTERAWYENGKLKAQQTFKAGRPDGWSREWYESGKLSAEQRYRNGKLEGIASKWFMNGHQQLAMAYANGLLDGRMTVWNEHGKVVAESQYRAGVQLDAKVSGASPAAK